jgi:hypothetical protein
MDISTARRKLESDQYTTIEQWKTDMDLIWTNTFVFNGQKSLLSVLARQCQTYFREITTPLSSDIDADWNSKFEKLKAEANALVKAAPRVSSASRLPRKAVPTRSSSMSQSVKSEEKPLKFLAPVTPTTAIEMSTEEIAKLAIDVNLIEDSDQVDEIIALIKRMEPEKGMNLDDEEVELDVSRLEPATMSELRLLVTKFLGR